jgi:hypothetical protein
MSFKRLLAAVALAFVAQSCSLYEGPAPVKKKEIPRLGCLKDFGARFVDYFEGRAGDDEVNRLADCSIVALRTFHEYARGEDRDRFTAEEIRNFLQRYFLEDIVLSDGLLRELMRVKQAFLGGKIEDFTGADLEYAEEVINTFRAVFLKLRRSMPISLDRFRREDSVYVALTTQAIIDASQILGTKITEIQSTYTFEELGRLVDELTHVFPGRANLMRPVREHLKIAGCLKETLVSPYRPRESVTALEWKTILEEGSRWFAAYAKFIHLEANHSDLLRGEGREKFSLLLYEVIDLLERATARHCPPKRQTKDGCRDAPGIPIASLEELLEESDWDGNLMGVEFGKTTIKGLISPVIRRIFGATDASTTGRRASRLTRDHLERVRGSIREWMDGARYIDALFSRYSGPSFTDSAEISNESIAAFSAREVLRPFGEVSEDGVELAESLRTLLARTQDLSGPDGKRVLYDGKNATRGRSYRELTRYAWLRPVLKRVVLGYIDADPASERVKEVRGLNAAEFSTFVHDYWPVFLDLKIVGPKNKPSEDATKRFRESALFTQLSDGDDLISVDEGVQLILLTFSADPMSKDAHHRISTVCGTKGLDDFDRPRVEPHCYRKKFYDLSRKNAPFADLWATIPLFVEFYEGLDTARRAEFLFSIETVSRRGGVQPDVYFDSAETQVTTMVYHYVEGIFQRFDADKNGKIDSVEAEKAFPVFQNTLASMAKMDPDSTRVKKIFFWLLAKGSPPISDGMGWWLRTWKSAGFLWWSWTYSDFEADRLGLLKVFAALASAETQAAAAKKSAR